MLSPRTERDYRQVVERWTREGQPDPATWVGERSSEATRRNARAGLVWHFRVNLGRTLGGLPSLACVFDGSDGPPSSRQSPHLDGKGRRLRDTGWVGRTRARNTSPAPMNRACPSQ